MWLARGMPSIASQLSSQVEQLQKAQREGLLMQLIGIQFLSGQGIALRGYSESEGNLRQLLLAWNENYGVLNNWIKVN